MLWADGTPEDLVAVMELKVCDRFAPAAARHPRPNLPSPRPHQGIKKREQRDLLFALGGEEAVAAAARATSLEDTVASMQKTLDSSAASFVKMFSRGGRQVPGK